MVDITVTRAMFLPVLRADAASRNISRLFIVSKFYPNFVMTS